MNMKRSIVTTLLVAAMVLTVASCGDQRSESERLQAAVTSFQKGEYREALIELKNLLQTNPRNIEARLLLGRTSIQMGDAATAEKEFSRAREIGATPDQYYPLLLKAMLLQGRHDDIVDEFDLAGVTTTENRHVAEVFLGNALFGLRRIGDAEAQFQKVIANATADDPLRRAHLGMAEVMRYRKNLDAAIDMARKSYEYGSDSSETALALGQLLLSNTNFEEAREQFDRVLKTPTATVNERFVSAAGKVEASLAIDDINSAKQGANLLFSIAPNHPLTGYLLGQVAYTEGDADAAYEYLQKVLARTPRFRPAQLLQGIISVERGEYEQAETYLSSFILDEPNNVMAIRNLAEARLQLSDPAGAIEVLREAIDAGVDDQQLVVMLGKANMQAGEQSAAIEELKKTLAEFPDNQGLRIALAAAYMTRGQTAEAIEMIDSIEGGDDTDQRRDLLRFMVAVNEQDDDAARAQAEAIASKWQNNPQANNLVGSWYLRKGELDTARTFFDKIYAESPTDINALTSLGKIDMQQKNYAQARERYLEFLEREPNNQAALLSLAFLYQAEGDAQNAFETITRAYASDPSAEVPGVILARYHLARRDYEKALEYASAAAVANPRSAIASQTRGAILLELDRFDEALTALTKAAELNPSSTQILHDRARAEFGSEQYAQARRTYQEIMDMEPQDLRAARNLALLEINAGNADKAETILQTLRESDTDQATLLEIEGDIRRENEDYVRALEAYERSWKERATRSVTLKLHDLTQRRGGNPAVYLRDWLERFPDDHAARKLLADGYQQRGQDDLAIAEYEQIIRQRPNNAEVLNNLAWLYFQQNATDTREKAIALGQKAYELAPGSPEIIDTYGWILFQSGQLEDGTRLLAEAETKAREQDLPWTSEIIYHHAAALHASGQRVGAKTRLREILESDAAFPSRGAAQRLFDSMD